MKRSYAGESSNEDSVSEIQIYLNEEKRQIIIQDTGIGMSRDELVQNLGTIARSGSQKFLEEIKETTGKYKLIFLKKRWKSSK